MQTVRAFRFHAKYYSTARRLLCHRYFSQIINSKKHANAQIDCNENDECSSIDQKPISDHNQIKIQPSSSFKFRPEFIKHFQQETSLSKDIYAQFHIAFNQPNKPEAFRLLNRIFYEFSPSETASSTFINRHYEFLLTNFRRMKLQGRIHLVLDEMKRQNIPVSLKCFNILLKSCRSYEALLSTWKDLKLNHKPDVFSYNAMIEALILQFNAVKEAEALLNEMILLKVYPDIVTTHLFISAHLKRNNLTTALQLMDKLVQDGLKPNYFTLSLFVRYFLHNKMIQSAMDMIKKFKNAGLLQSNETLDVNTGLIKHFTEANALIEAELLLSDMHEVEQSRLSHHAYQFIINGYVRNKDSTSLYNFYHKLKSNLKLSKSQSFEFSDLHLKTLFEFFASEPNCQKYAKLVVELFDKMYLLDKRRRKTVLRSTFTFDKALQAESYTVAAADQMKLVYLKYQRIANEEFNLKWPSSNAPFNHMIAAFPELALHFKDHLNLVSFPLSESSKPAKEDLNNNQINHLFDFRNDKFVSNT